MTVLERVDEKRSRERMTPELLDEMSRRAHGRMARERLSRIEEMRDVVRLNAQGLSQREIAKQLLTTQPRVMRILQAASLRGDLTDGQLPVMPEELILRTAVEHGDRRVMVQALKNFQHTESRYAPYPAQGKISGTMDQIEDCYRQGYLSADEFAEVRAVA